MANPSVTDPTEISVDTAAPAASLYSIVNLLRNLVIGLVPFKTMTALNNSTAPATTAYVDAAVTGGAPNWAAPGTIGSTTPNTGAFTTLSANNTVSGAGFSAYLASPPAIGGTAASTGKFTTALLTTAAPASPVAGTLYLNCGRWVRIGTASFVAGSPELLIGANVGAATNHIVATIDGRYSALRFYLLGLHPSAINNAMLIQISEDGGSTFKSGATNYLYGGWAVDSGGSSGAVASAGTTQIAMTGANLTNAAGASGMAIIDFESPGDTTRRKNFTWATCIEGGTRIHYNGSGAYTADTAAIDGFRFFVSPNNLDAGLLIADGLLSV